MTSHALQQDWRDKESIHTVLKAIWQESKHPLRLMEVCGTHTVAIFRYGLRQLLPKHIELISGPGCPVCVTPTSEIDLILELATQPEVMIASFGDLLAVPGTEQKSLKTIPAQVQIVYSPTDALALAQRYPEKKVVFCAIGFETTAPSVAYTIKYARHSQINNFWILSLHKLIPPAIKALLSDGQCRVDGFICPGHVSVIIGWQVYRFISQEYGIPAVVAGFEPLDILMAVLMLVRQHEAGSPKVENCYPRAVDPDGNKRAQSILYEVFTPTDTDWRGLGMIPGSGLKLLPAWQDFDASAHFNLSIKQEAKPTTPCACGEILKGIMTPPQCPAFAGVCTPDNPLGPCMVSSEGSCAAYFRYGIGK